MNKRLASFLAAENITQTQLADILHVAKASVSNILAGKNKPGFDFLESLSLHYPDLNIDWLINGRGRMYTDAKEPEIAPQSANFGPIIETDTLDAANQTSEIQRTVTRITIYFSDGTYQDITC